MIHLRLAFGAILLLLLLVTRGAPSWRPIVIALWIPWALDCLADGGWLPARADLALWLASPALSGWCAWRVLGRASPGWCAAWTAALWTAGASFVCYAPQPAAWWDALPLACRLAAMVAQGAAVVAWLRRSRPWTTAELGAALLFAGDVGSLAGPAGMLSGSWWFANAQALAIGLAALALAATRGSRSVE